ncbi:hypothetical protein OTSKATO_0949 [Orientia tsutsugamushi str. Kato PP]|nr:hypothetical protein OTSKATO_0949 [Orientia tsutsugamushi str. Kato PP]
MLLILNVVSNSSKKYGVIGLGYENLVSIEHLYLYDIFIFHVKRSSI